MALLCMVVLLLSCNKNKQEYLNQVDQITQTVNCINDSCDQLPIEILKKQMSEIKDLNKSFGRLLDKLPDDNEMRIYVYDVAALEKNTKKGLNRLALLYSEIKNSQNKLKNLRDDINHKAWDDEKT